MIIKTKKYVIATKSFPLRFNDGRGNMESDFEDAAISSQIECENQLTYFDEPDKHQILEVNVTYEF